MKKSAKISQKIIEIISDMTTLNQDNLRPFLMFESLDIDTMCLYSICAEIYQCYSVVVSEKEIKQLITLEDLIALVIKKIRKRVLIVDDYDGIRESMKLLLESHDIVPFTAQNEAEAIDIVNDEELDAIVIELVLPANFLTNPGVCEKGNRYIGAGLYLLRAIEAKLTKKKEEVNIIIHTSFEKGTLITEGFPEIESNEGYSLFLKGWPDTLTLIELINH